MNAGQSGESRWHWRQVSPRRVVGQLLRSFGFVGLLLPGSDLVRGSWEPSFDPAMLCAATVALAVSVVVLRGVKPAPWP